MTFFCSGQNPNQRPLFPEVRNSRVTKPIYETELCKMTSHFELLTRSRKIKVSLQVTNLKSENKKFHVELLTRSQKIKNYTSSC